MRRLSLLTLTLTLIGAPLVARATPEASTLRARVHRLLSARHGLPGPAHFEALGPEGRQLLLELGADPKANPWQRGRALQALSRVPGPELELVYREILADALAPLGLRRQVVILYAQTFPGTARSAFDLLGRDPAPELRRVVQVNLQKLDAAARPE